MVGSLHQSHEAILGSHLAWLTFKPKAAEKPVVNKLGSRKASHSQKFVSPGSEGKTVSEADTKPTSVLKCGKFHLSACSS